MAKKTQKKVVAQTKATKNQASALKSNLENLKSAKKSAATENTQIGYKGGKKDDNKAEPIKEVKESRRGAKKIVHKSETKQKVVTHESTPSPKLNKSERQESSETKRFKKLAFDSKNDSGSKADCTTRPNNDTISGKLLEENSNTNKKSASENILKSTAKKQFSGKIDTASVNDDLSKLIKKIDQNRQSSKSTEKKRIVRSTEKKFSAKSHNYELQKIKGKHTPIINLFELAHKHEFTNSDVILALIEIALHAEFYSIPKIAGKVSSFWEEIVQYNELKRLFQFYRPETLKKYWRLISYKNSAEKASAIVKQNKRLIDEQNPK